MLLLIMVLANGAFWKTCRTLFAWVLYVLLRGVDTLSAQTVAYVSNVKNVTTTFVQKSKSWSRKLGFAYVHRPGSSDCVSGRVDS